MASYLMYHELERPGRALCDDSPGYIRYVVREEDFLRQLDHLRARGNAGLDVSTALMRPSPGVAITFDDGCETDLLIAAPALRERDFGATFYITTGFLGQRGYLDSQQLRTLAESGFEIGSHGVTHRFLPDLPDEALLTELSDSKRRLEDIVGRPVAHLSCPGGRWDERVALWASNVGYVTVATSRPGLNPARADKLNLARNVILRHTSLSAFEQVCGGRRTGMNHVRTRALDFAKVVLGNRAYVQLRSAALLGAKWTEVAVRRFHGATRG